MTSEFIRVQGWDIVVKAHLKIMEGLRPRGGFGEGIFAMAIKGRAVSESVTHRVTSALSQSHRVRFSATGIEKSGGPQAEIYVTPIRNPISGITTSEYAGIEDARGGDHAFYEIVVEKHSKSLFTAFVGPFQRGIGF